MRCGAFSVVNALETKRLWVSDHKLGESIYQHVDDLRLTLLEEMLPHKVSTPVKEFFEWRRKERELLEVESSAKGEELAYLVEVEHFLSS